MQVHYNVYNKTTSMLLFYYTCFKPFTKITVFSYNQGINNEAADDLALAWWMRATRTAMEDKYTCQNFNFRTRVLVLRRISTSTCKYMHLSIAKVIPYVLNVHPSFQFIEQETFAGRLNWRITDVILFVVQKGHLKAYLFICSTVRCAFFCVN